MTRADHIKEKRRLARLKKRQQEKEEVLAADAGDVSVADDEDSDLEQKDMGDMDMAQPEPAPTTFKELQDYKIMAEREEKIQEAACDVQNLVYNILYRSPNLSATEKASKINTVGSEFGAVVQNIISQDDTQVMSDALDLDLLAVKAMLGAEARQTSALDNILDWVSKRKLTARSENALSDADFALVYTDKDGNKVRKYPIHDKAHVRDALARAAQMMEQGGAAAEDARKALPKIHTAAKKMGIGSTSKSAVIVEKGLDGTWRAVMFPSNNYIDWHGDILSASAHLEYVEWVNKNMDAAPLFMTWHVPGTARKSAVDFVGYENGFVVMSAPLTEREASGLLRVQAQCDLGMSHTSLVLERDSSDPRVVTKYRTIEVTDLPLDAAANPFTSLEVVNKEAAMDTKAYLAAILGSDEKAEKFLERTGMKKKEMDAAQIPSKEKEVEETKPAAVPTMDEMIERISKEFGMEELSSQFSALKERAEKVDTLEALVRELVVKKEDALAEMIQPKAARSLSWMSARPSQKSETVVDETKPEDKKLAEAKPSGGWLSDVTHTAPVN